MQVHEHTPNKSYRCSKHCDSSSQGNSNTSSQETSTGVGLPALSEGVVSKSDSVKALSESSSADTTDGESTPNETSSVVQEVSIFKSSCSDSTWAVTIFKENPRIHNETVLLPIESCVDWDFTNFMNNSHSPINEYMQIMFS